MIATSTTSVVGSLVVVAASSAVAASASLFWLTAGDVRICGSSAARDADILWLVLYHCCSCSTTKWMYALLHLANKTSSAIDVAALLDGMFVIII